MQALGEFGNGTIERLTKQGKFLERLYRAEMDKAPASLATESSRSNWIAMRHTVKQIYGNAIGPDFSDLRGH
jgi:hypothetical protein